MTRLTRALLAPVALLLALAGCGALPAAPTPATPEATPAGPTEAAGDGATTITFAAPEFERAAYQALADAFHADNPDVRVRVVSLDEVVAPENGQIDIDQMMRSIAGAADAAAPPFVRGEDATTGLLLDLAPLMDADPSFERGDFYPGALDSLARDGGVYLLPRTLNVPLLAYNKDLWAAAGLPAPTPGWTWEDFLGAAAALAQTRGGEVDTYGYAAFDAGLAALLGALAAAGDPLAGDSAGDARLDRPEVAAALGRIAELTADGALTAPPAQGASAFQEIQGLIREGRAAIWPDGLLFAGPDAPPPSFGVGVAPLPQPQVTSEPGVGASGYIISAGTQHPREAWRWLAFVSSQQVERPAGVVLVGAGRAVPARRSLAEQSGFWDDLDAEARAAIEYALAQPAPQADARARHAREALREALAAAVGGAAPAQALADAQAALETRLASATPEPTPSGPVAVATPEVVTVPEGATVIRFAAPFLAPGELRRAAAAFSAANPSLAVEIVPGGDGNGRALAQQADCFMLPGTPDASEPLTGTLDLRPLLDADPSFDAADYPPALLAPLERDGALRGLPYAVSLRELSYNQDAFRAAGLEPPQATWRLDDMLAAALRLTGGDDEQTRTYGFASTGAMAEDLRFFLGQAGAQLVAGPEGRPNFSDPQVVQAVRAYLDLIERTSPHDRLGGYDRREPLLIGESFELVQGGRVGMWFGFGLGVVLVRVGGPERPAFSTAVAPPPLAGGAVTADDVQLTGMYISAESKQPQACWEWLKHLSRDTSLVGDAYPARRSLAESDAFLGQARPGAAEVYRAYGEALGRPLAASAGAAAADLFWFYRAVDRALQGADLERELADAEELTAQFTACVAGGGARAECATAVDPEYGGFAE